jgi:hypothetical protein
MLSVVLFIVMLNVVLLSGVAPICRLQQTLFGQSYNFLFIVIGAMMEVSYCVNFVNAFLMRFSEQNLCQRLRL